MKSGKGRERCIQITLPLGELRTGQIGTRYYDIIHRWVGTSSTSSAPPVVGRPRRHSRAGVWLSECLSCDVLCRWIVCESFMNGYNKLTNGGSSCQDWMKKKGSGSGGMRSQRIWGVRTTREERASNPCNGYERVFICVFSPAEGNV